MMQHGAVIEEGADPRKYEVNQRLRFVGHDPEEEPADYDVGDVLLVEEDALRDQFDGSIAVSKVGEVMVSFVWPTEVEVIEEVE
jgi:hypothetical protein